MKDSEPAYEQLSVEEEDAISRFPRRKAQPVSAIYRNVLLGLALIGLGGYGLLHYSHPARLIATNTPAPQIPAAVSAHTPIPDTPQTPATQQDPRSLADCMGPGNVIDQAVATCRFGQRPPVAHDPQAQGMVSARYMSDYRDRQQARPSKAAQVQNVETARVWQWDRKRTWVAEWLVSENAIDGSSVCRNWRTGSIEYRECRKGAKLYFREQCRSGRDSAARQRFCSAGEGFNPL